MMNVHPILVLFILVSYATRGSTNGVCEVPTGLSFCSFLNISEPVYRANSDTFLELDLNARLAYLFFLGQCGLQDESTNDTTGCFMYFKNFVCSTAFPKCDPRTGNSQLGTCLEACQKIAPCPNLLNAGPGCIRPDCVVDGSIINFRPLCSDWLENDQTTGYGGTSGSSTGGDEDNSGLCLRSLSHKSTSITFQGSSPNFIIRNLDGGASFTFGFVALSEVKSDQQSEEYAVIPSGGYNRTCEVKQGEYQFVRLQTTLSNGAYLEFRFWMFEKDANLSVGSGQNEFHYVVTEESWKFSINVENWPFKSTSNRLNLVLETTSSEFISGFNDTSNSDFLSGIVTTTETVFSYKFIKFAILDGNLFSTIPTTIFNVNNLQSGTLNYLRFVVPFLSFNRLEYDPEFKVLFTGSRRAGEEEEEEGKSNSEKDDDSGNMIMIAGVSIGVVALIAIVLSAIAYSRILAKRKRFAQLRMELSNRKQG